MTLSIQFGVDETPEQEPQESGSQMQVHNADGHFSFDGSEGRHHVSASVSKEDFYGQHGSGILRTAQTKFGSPASTLTPDCLVEHGGTQMTLLQAERMGLVHRDAAGRYVEAGQQQPAKTVERQEAAEEAPKEGVDDMQHEPFSPDVEQSLAELVQDASAPAVAASLVGMCEQLLENGKLEVNIEQFASRAGMTMENADKFVGPYINALAEQVDVVLDKAGVGRANGVAFFEWARENRPAQLKQAWANHSLNRSASGWRSLAQDFMRNSTRSAGWLQHAGYETRMEGKELMVKYQGTWMTARSAARLGLV